MGNLMMGTYNMKTAQKTFEDSQCFGLVWSSQTMELLLFLN